MAKLLSLIGLVIFGGTATILGGLIIYILLTDGVANLRGEGETGWAAGIALLFYLPVTVVLASIALWFLRRYKKYSI